MRKKQLPWNLHYTAHSPMPPILQSLHSFAQRVSLISSHPQIFSIQNSINFISSSIFIQWIPGHSAIPGSDLASKAAKEATTVATDTIFSISLSSSIQVINEMICDAPPIHEQVASVYQHQKVSWDAKQIKQQKRWCSHCSFTIRQYLHWLDLSQDPTCPIAAKNKISFTGSASAWLW